jgi:hypothetical protein
MYMCRVRSISFLLSVTRNGDVYGIKEEIRGFEICLDLSIFFFWVTLYSIASKRNSFEQSGFSNQSKLTRKYTFDSNLRNPSLS